MSDGPAAAAPHPLPFRLEGRRGSLAALYYPPAAGVAPRGAVLVAPPFSEEMNRCRSMVSQQARRLALSGLGTLVVDPYGTGDSAGEFSEATWADWQADLLLGADWLDAHAGGCVAVLGVRLGAIMAAQIARQRAGVRHLLLWQPVLNGKTFYTQFLRIRLAAEMSQAGQGPRIKTTGELRKLSADGHCVEVSGYEIGPALAGELDTLVFDLAGHPAPPDVEWFEVAGGSLAGAANSGTPPVDGSPESAAEAGASAPELLPASVNAVKKLTDQGVVVRTTVVSGPPFWYVHERELAPELVEATAAACATWPAAVQPAADALQAVAAGHGAPTPERLVSFDCGQDRLVGCLHTTGDAAPRRGVVIVVAGGPQYRVGAHRQFVNLARRLAAQGQPVLRFDLRGMGDSSGEYQGFQHSAADIRAAVDTLMQLQPTLQDVLLIGECESASGILFYAWQDTRVGGAVLVNPWVRSAEGQAQVIVKRYYLDRLRSGDFWRKLLSGRWAAGESLRSLRQVLRDYLRGRRQFRQATLVAAGDDMSALPLPVKTATGLSRFKGRVLLLMSGHDYIAREFDEVTAASAAWAGLLQSPRLVRRDIAAADHTFSRREWKDEAASTIAEWARAG